MYSTQEKEFSKHKIAQLDSTPFVKARKLFNKLVRQKERQYKRSYIYNLEKLNTSNHEEFWNILQNFGSKKN